MPYFFLLLSWGKTWQCSVFNSVFVLMVPYVVLGLNHIGQRYKSNTFMLYSICPSLSRTFNHSSITTVKYDTLVEILVVLISWKHESLQSPVHGTHILPRKYFCIFYRQELQVIFLDFSPKLSWPFQTVSMIGFLLSLLCTGNLPFISTS